MAWKCVKHVLHTSANELQHCGSLSHWYSWTDATRREPKKAILSKRVCWGGSWLCDLLFLTITPWPRLQSTLLLSESFNFQTLDTRQDCAPVRGWRLEAGTWWSLSSPSSTSTSTPSTTSAEPPFLQVVFKATASTHQALWPDMSRRRSRYRRFTWTFVRTRFLKKYRWHLLFIFQRLYRQGRQLEAGQTVQGPPFPRLSMQYHNYTRWDVIWTLATLFFSTETLSWLFY